MSWAVAPLANHLHAIGSRTAVNEKQWPVVVMLLGVRCWWRHTATTNSCFKSNDLAKFFDTMHIIMLAVSFVCLTNCCLNSLAWKNWTIVYLCA